VGSSSTTPDRWPGTGSIRNGVPKKSRHRGKARGIPIGAFCGWKTDLLTRQVPSARVLTLPVPRMEQRAEEPAAEHPVPPDE
jgi:hypothetical protein